MNRPTKRLHRVFFMLGLIIAGEAIFALPFHVTRFFRPVVLDVFNEGALGRRVFAARYARSDAVYSCSTQELIAMWASDQV